MHVSLQSKVYVGTCVAVSAYAAYSDPVRWVTWYAIGVVVGAISGYSDLQDAIKEHQPENGLK
jgi:hypothetical protein